MAALRHDLLFDPTYPLAKSPIAAVHLPISTVHTSLVLEAELRRLLISPKKPSLLVLPYNHRRDIRPGRIAPLPPHVPPPGVDPEPERESARDHRQLDAVPVALAPDDAVVRGREAAAGVDPALAGGRRGRCGGGEGRERGGGHGGEGAVPCGRGVVVGAVRVEVAPEGDGEDVAAKHGRERDEAPVLREMGCNAGTPLVHLRAACQGGEPLTQTEPLDDERREEPEKAAIREAEERACFPEVAYALNGETHNLRDDEHRRNEHHAV